MDSVFFIFLLPILLAVMMMGLGLELSIQDFLRVSRYPKVIFVALFSQLVILTSIAFLICIVLHLPPLLAVGLMLLAGSPGGPTASLFSYLYQGDVALNITITALNTLVSIFTLPFIIKMSLIYFVEQHENIVLPTIRIVQVFMIMAVPVLLGMLIRAKLPALSKTMHRPMRIFSITFLILLFSFASFQERYHLYEYFESIGMAMLLFCFASLFIGYCVPLLMGIPDQQARACSFEIGIHNTAIAMTMALAVMENVMIAVPAGMYTLIMYSFASIFGFLISRQPRVLATPKNGSLDL